MQCDLARREVSTEEGAAFAREKRLVFLEASAKTSEHVEEAFLYTAQKIYTNIQRGVYDLNDQKHGIKRGTKQIGVDLAAQANKEKDEKPFGCC